VLFCCIEREKAGKPLVPQNRKCLWFHQGSVVSGFSVGTLTQVVPKKEPQTKQKQKLAEEGSNFTNFPICGYKRLENFNTRLEDNQKGIKREKRNRRTVECIVSSCCVCGAGLPVVRLQMRCFLLLLGVIFTDLKPSKKTHLIHPTHLARRVPPCVY